MNTRQRANSCSMPVAFCNLGLDLVFLFFPRRDVPDCLSFREKVEQDESLTKRETTERSSSLSLTVPFSLSLSSFRLIYLSRSRNGKGHDECKMYNKIARLPLVLELATMMTRLRDFKGTVPTHRRRHTSQNWGGL